MPSKSGYKFTAKPASVNNVSGDITIVISYSKKSSGGSSSSPAKYKVTTVTSDNGTITPQNPKVEKGGSQTFTIIPEEGKEVADVLIDGESIGAVITYTIENVKEAHKIEVVYKEKEEIESSDWAKDEMKEADARNLIPESIRSKDLTKIINRTEFAAISVKMYEALTGTQAEIPEVNPFIDTDDEEVLKAYGLGITVGTSEITFEGELEIPREQMVTMVTRALKRAGIDTSVEFEQANKFGDDHLMHYWGREPIYFMNSKNIVVGMGNNRFGVSENSTIEQAIAVSLRSVKSFENN